MESLEAGTISACILALVILIAFVIYTWMKWRRNQLNAPQVQRPKDPENGFKHNEKSEAKPVQNYNHAVSVNSMDDLEDKERCKDNERKDLDNDCYPYKGKQRGDSFRDRKTQQETTYL